MVRSDRPTDCITWRAQRNAVNCRGRPLSARDLPGSNPALKMQSVTESVGAELQRRESGCFAQQALAASQRAKLGRSALEAAARFRLCEFKLLVQSDQVGIGIPKRCHLCEVRGPLGFV